MKLGRIFLFCLLLSAALAPAAFAQSPEIRWRARLEPADARAGETAQVVVEATVEAPWHIYSLTSPEGGPLPTQLELEGGAALQPMGPAVQPPPHREFDRGFQMEVEYFPGAVAFGIPVRIRPGVSGPQRAAVRARFMACKEGQCTRPLRESIPVTFAVASGPARPDRQAAITAPPTQPAGHVPVAAAGGAPAAGTAPARAENAVEAAQRKGLLAFLAFSFVSGLLALLTPCVFPMIPITVSYFAKQKEGAGGQSWTAGVRPALAYCLGIVVTFTGLGVLMSALFGPTSLQRFATNPFVNLGLAALFVVMAVNLFGGFEIVLPGWLAEKAQAGARHGGLLGPMAMGLAFTITSFTCTVAFVGTLLATAAASGNYLYPTVGMLGFSTAFAAPFFLLALFPQYLARMPKSGGWLVTVKAFLGFLELMAALKFLSNADLYWQLGLLTRPVFLAIWFALAAVAGLYLLGLLRLPHDPGARVGPGRFVVGVASLAASVWFLSGINGAPMSWAVAFLPPPDYGAPAAVALGAARAGEELTWTEDYDAALRQARAEGKLLFLDFTGYQCSNCRVMEQEVFPQPAVRDELARMVRVRLYTDGNDERSRRYARMQVERYGQTTLPLYVILTPDEQKIAETAFDTDVQRFLRFLREAQAKAAPLLKPGPELTQEESGRGL